MSKNTEDIYTKKIDPLSSTVFYRIFIPITRRVKGYTRFVGKYVTCIHLSIQKEHYYTRYS